MLPMSGQWNKTELRVKMMAKEPIVTKTMNQKSLLNTSMKVVQVLVDFGFRKKKRFSAPNKPMAKSITTEKTVFC